MTLAMVPKRESLTDVLPTDRLTKSGMPTPEIRAELRKIASLSNIGSLVLCWSQAFFTIGAAIWINNLAVYAVSIVLMGATFARFSILAHEAAHRLMFRNKKLNDFFGKWFLAYPAFIPFSFYRISHFSHHRDELGPKEPDLSLYRDYPISKASFKRKLSRDGFGVSGWKNLKVLIKAIFNKVARPIALPIIATQVALLLVCILAGYPLAYFGLWLIPWMTSWRVLNRLRAIAEHGGMKQSSDRRETTHHVKQHLIARFFIVPFNAGWHLAHHTDMGVPWRNLPKLQMELEAAGWVTDSITWPNYTSLWKALSSRTE